MFGQPSKGHHAISKILFLLDFYPLKIAKEIDLDTVFAEKIFNLIVNEVKNNHNKMKK